MTIKGVLAGLLVALIIVHEGKYTHRKQIYLMIKKNYEKENIIEFKQLKNHGTVYN